MPLAIYDLIKFDVFRKEEKDFIIVRPNGHYIFHLVNLVHDMLMKITHVISGEDQMSNTNKHVELFKAFRVVPYCFLISL
jgi:glutamyl-tRNA synthetase